MSVRVALAVGLALATIAGGLVMAKAPARVAGTNSIRPHVQFADLRQGEQVCQAGETLPRDTSAVRLDLEAVLGPSVTVTALAGEDVLTGGTRGSGWTGGDVTVPVERVPRGISDATLCVSIGPTSEVLPVLGQKHPDKPAAVLSAGAATGGRMGVEYLAPGLRSWWSLALPVARRMGLGRAPSGTWIALLIALVMTVTAVLGLGLALRALRPGASSLECAPHREVRLPIRLPRPLSRVPGIAWGCALVAFLNAACWSEVSPPLQTPDEPAHFAYVQELAEAHRLPTHGTTYSPEEEVALADLHHNAVQFVPGAATISSRAQQRKLQHDLRAGYARVGPADAGTAASEPPTYYALEAIPYELGSGGTLLARLQLMRLLSALFGGLTALFAYLFVREALPGAPWAWAVGGLGVAFAPALGYMSGAVNPDAMLFAVSAALFYLLARAYRRGLTVRLATAIGATMALGSLTKLNFYGLIPGALAALVVLAIRRRPTSRRAAHVALAVTCAVAVCPTLAYTALASPVSHPPLSELSSAAATATHQGSTLEEISYSWQLFLPRLPGMTNYFPGISTWRQLWFDGLVGLYGWADTQFPVWVYELALIAAALIGLLCARELIRTRTTLVRRAGELATYALMAAGVMALVGAASYGAGAPHGPPFWEPRYLLPMLPLFGALLALAARGAGRRWGPAAGMLLVVLVLSHDIFSQLLVVSRYYH